MTDTNAPIKRALSSDDAATSDHPQETPSPRQISQTLQRGDENTLDKAIDLVAKKLRVAKKRLKLAELKRSLRDAEAGLEQMALPLPRTESVAFQPRYSITTAQLKAPVYKGDTYESLQNFLSDLNAAFTMDHYNVPDDATKVAYASCCLADDAKRQWIRYAAVDGLVQYQEHTWTSFVEWLKRGTMDEDLRCLEATKTLTGLRQEEGQSFQAYKKIWRRAEAELPERISERLQICMFINSLNNATRKQVLSQEFPKSWNHLVGQASRRRGSLPGAR